MSGEHFNDKTSAICVCGQLCFISSTSEEGINTFLMPIFIVGNFYFSVKLKVSVCRDIYVQGCGKLNHKSLQMAIKEWSGSKAWHNRFAK